MKILVIVLFLFSSGCSAISTALTPKSVTDAVARGLAVSKASLEDPPKSEKDMTDYHEANYKLWKQLAIWHELIPNEEWF